MFHVVFARLYVTLASTRPGMPFSELAGSVIEKVMELLDSAVTFQTR